MTATPPAEPEHPAPTPTLTTASRSHGEHTAAAAAQAAPDATARWLGGAGIAVGVIGAVLALLLRHGLTGWCW